MIVGNVSNSEIMTQNLNMIGEFLCDLLDNIVTIGEREKLARHLSDMWRVQWLMRDWCVTKGVTCLTNNVSYGGGILSEQENISMPIGWICQEHSECDMLWVKKDLECAESKVTDKDCFGGALRGEECAWMEVDWQSYERVECVEYSEVTDKEGCGAAIKDVSRQTRSSKKRKLEDENHEGGLETEQKRKKIKMGAMEVCRNGPEKLAGRKN